MIYHARVAKVATIDTESMCSDTESFMAEMDDMGEMEENGCPKGIPKVVEECAPLELSSEVEGDIEDFAQCDADGAEQPNFYLNNFECKEDEENTASDAEEVIVNYFSGPVVGVVRNPSM
jgi:hypothetical protein